MKPAGLRNGVVAGAGMGVGLVGAAPPASARRLRRVDLADLGARAAVIVLFTLLAISIGRDFVQTGRITAPFLLASETLVVVLTLLRRSAIIVDRSSRARLLTGFSLLGPVLVRPADVAPIAAEPVTVLVSALGLVIVIAGKLSLGRSFGLMPANRGIVQGGLYRIVRHPIYSGYLVTHIAFLAANPSAWNIAMLVAADLALLCRALHEERTLLGDPAYRAYSQSVRWRILPGLF